MEIRKNENLEIKKNEKVVKWFNSPLELHADDWHNVWSDLIFD